MILRFKTKRNQNGNRRYLALDTERMVYTTLSAKMIMEGEEVTTTTIRNIRLACEAEGYKETGEAF